MHSSAGLSDVQVNVLITEDGVAVLADFGLTKATQTGASQSVDQAGIGQSLYRYTGHVTCLIKLAPYAYQVCDA